MTPIGQAPPRKLLVVDDDSTIRTLLFTALHGQYDVLCVPNGTEAPGFIASHDPDLLLLDINIPGSDCYALCEGIREQAARRNLPIIFMTVCEDAAGFFDSLATGVNSYIKKPFEMPRLKKRIESKLKPRPSA